MTNHEMYDVDNQQALDNIGDQTDGDADFSSLNNRPNLTVRQHMEQIRQRQLERAMAFGIPVLMYVA